jgi:hypothetical protein
VRFAGVLGHLDRYVAADATLIDTKTTSDRWLQHIKVHGASRDHLWQTHLYGAALIAEGKPVRRIVIDYLARDTGNDHQVSVAFQPAIVREALDWLKTVRETPLDYLNRDYQPDSSFCEHCPFRDTCWAGGVAERDPRSVLYVEDPDAAKWAEQLWRAREAKAEAEEARSRGQGRARRAPADQREGLAGRRRRLPPPAQVDRHRARPTRHRSSQSRVRQDRRAAAHEAGKPTIKLEFAESVSA